MIVVSSRDFVLVTRRFVNPDGSWTILAKSCDWDYPEKKSTVRGELVVGGWMLKAESETSV